MISLPVGYIMALGRARSCLAALADIAPMTDESTHFDRLLIELDRITGDVGPACSPMVETRVDLLDCLEAAVERLVEYGVDRLSLELLIIAASDGPAPQTMTTPRRDNLPTRPPWQGRNTDARHDDPRAE